MGGLCLKITQTRPYVKHYVIANIYRPPYEAIDDLALFNEQFITLLNSISEKRHSSYICDDFNINLLKINLKAYYNIFFENTLLSGFPPKITLPTRISKTCSTHIDNILTNVIEPNHDKAGVLTSHISDHQAIFLFTNSKLSRDNGSKYINVETKDDTSLNNFINELENLNIPAYQGWGQVQLTKYSSTPSTPNIYQVQVLVKYSFFLKVLKYIKYFHIKYKYSY